MNTKPKLPSIRFALGLAAGLAAATVSTYAQTATATISGAQAGGVYNYTLTLNNTGSLALESFWYGWTTSGNNLPSVPTNPGNLIGWANSLFGNSIKYTGSSLTPIAPNQSAIFTFTSTATPAQMTAGTAGQSVAYVGAIDSSQNVPGDSTPVFAPVLITVPESSSASLFVLGSLGWLATGWRRLRA